MIKIGESFISLFAPLGIRKYIELPPTKKIYVNIISKNDWKGLEDIISEP